MILARYDNKKADQQSPGLLIGSPSTRLVPRILEAAVSERAMTSEEMEALLRETHLTTLGTVRRDGSPQISPVWYEYDGQGLLIIAHENTAKVHNIRRDPRVVLSIATPTEPYSYVLIQGTAEVTTRNVEEVTSSICIRYRGRDRGSIFARELLEEGGTVVIEVSPTKIITWVYED